MAKNYVDKVEAMPEEAWEFIHEELAWPGEWVNDNSLLKNYREVNRFLHEMLDDSIKLPLSPLL